MYTEKGLPGTFTEFAIYLISPGGSVESHVESRGSVQPLEELRGSVESHEESRISVQPLVESRGSVEFHVE